MIKILRQRRLPAGRQGSAFGRQGRQGCPPPEGILLRRKNSKIKSQNDNLKLKINKF